jgi:hypothetical protein
MIKIIVEVWPGGFEEIKYRIGEMDIVNEMTHPDHPRRGNYGVRLYRRGSRMIRRTGEVCDHPRRSKDVWHLVKQAIDSVL